MTTTPRMPATIDATNSSISGLSVSDLAPIPRYRVLKHIIRMHVAGEMLVITPALRKSTGDVRLARLSRTARDRVSRAVKVARGRLSTQVVIAS